MLSRLNFNFNLFFGEAKMGNLLSLMNKLNSIKIQRRSKNKIGINFGASILFTKNQVAQASYGID